MLFRDREYKSGTQWCVWRWTDIDSEYIVRLHLIKTPWFAVCLHWILKPDPEPWLHDHPVSFLSIIIRGWYVEKRYTYWPGLEFSERIHKRYNYIKACLGDTHTIVDCDPNTLTLCLMGPKVREWGFHTDHGWVHWKEYYKQKKENV